MTMGMKGTLGTKSRKGTPGRKGKKGKTRHFAGGRTKIEAFGMVLKASLVFAELSECLCL